MHFTLKPFALLLFLGLTLVSCSDDDETPATGSDFVVAFENPSVDFSAEDSNSLTVNLVFSTKAPVDGYVDVTFESEELVYDTNFSTTPTLSEGFIRVPVSAGSSAAEFTVNKKDLPIAEDLAVKFSIVKVQLGSNIGATQGNTSVVVSFSGAAALGGTIAPEVGGPNEPNQVYIDLSSQKNTVVRRDTWDLGFYSGDEFRVKLNGSMYMFVGQLPENNIDAVQTEAVETLKPKMAFMLPGSNQYVDNPNGNIDGTAIAAISADAAQNPVYLLKLGSEIGTNTPETGSVAIAGEDRGYLKIRILRQDNGYVLQYAELGATTHQEVVIPKSAGFNYSFFSFTTGSTVQVQPAQNAWDLNFTVHTEVEELPSGELTAYGFSDYVETNVLGDVKAYQVSPESIAYEDFAKSDVDQAHFVEDQQVIGSNWRNVFEHNLTDVYYIIKDADGNLYKLQFTAFTNSDGVRGYPEFKYKLLQ